MKKKRKAQSFSHTGKNGIWQKKKSATITFLSWLTGEPNVNKTWQCHLVSVDKTAASCSRREGAWPQVNRDTETQFASGSQLFVICTTFVDIYTSLWVLRRPSCSNNRRLTKYTTRLDVSTIIWWGKRSWLVWGCGVVEIQGWEMFITLLVTCHSWDAKVSIEKYSCFRLVVDKTMISLLKVC